MTKEEEILIAAEDVFFRCGYDAASTAVIAKAAGVTHAMVNYYFRSKEGLFSKILDNHITSLMSCLKSIMNAEGDIVGIVTNVTLAIFDRMNEDRKLPFLLQDMSRNHPEFLLRYNDIFRTVCVGSIEKHSRRLEKYISDGILVPCSMMDICDTAVTLATAPFLNIPMLTNVAGYPKERVDDYLADRRREIEAIIRSRYSPSTCGDTQFQATHRKASLSQL